ncbi:iron-sulfur cluster biosynthesis family protein [Terrilactibacillus laevilacticus]|uniref:Iron-sulfur cluster biosynthesis family protein n=1 Tax=Terrilactibacillus laevilacticus TaxID=1380157 RepID=A0ABW5PS76_9BACI|nr:iron-sulfur cluster biosynthesis family protein [Terrilactibacillus laevilacticus]
MHITWTEQAQNKIHEIIKQHPNGHFVLNYDREGCGCSDDGIYTLGFTDEPIQNEVQIDTNSVPIYVMSYNQVYLDNEMTIDYDEKTKNFDLKSLNQIMNQAMSCVIDLKSKASNKL